MILKAVGDKANVEINKEKVRRKEGNCSGDLVLTTLSHTAVFIFPSPSLRATAGSRQFCGKG